MSEEEEDRTELEKAIRQIFSNEELAAERTDVRVVRGSTGMEFEVLNEAEESWFNENLKKYLDEYRFENVADLHDVDRLVSMELVSNRHMHWILKGSDYWGAQFDDRAVRDHKQKTDQEIRLLKKQMGMDRKNRMESESESVAEYLTNLKRRAEEFGIHRDNQIAIAIDLFNELKKLVGLLDRTDEEEQRHLDISPIKILDWIREVAIPRYDAIDEAFLVNQRLWIKEVS